MIQFRRGTTRSWRNAKIKLASGQPGYDKDKHKIKIGDGEKSWAELPYVGGLSEKEILDSEENAKSKVDTDAEDKTIITYGTEAPDENTIGQLYLQQCNADCIVEAGISAGWMYQVYNSGIIKCFGEFKVKLDIVDNIEGTGLFCDNSTFKKDYPQPFKNPPLEVASVRSSNGITWIVNKGINTTTSSGIYAVVSPASANNLECTISVWVEGIKE